MLTDTQCRAAKGKDKAYKLSDSQGLYLHVATSGHRTWRHKYRYGKIERHRVIGAYPDVGLREAREARDADKRLLKAGLDPVTEAKRLVLANQTAASDTFETVARDWHRQQKARWVQVHAADVIESLERDLFPTLGKLPITRIDRRLVLQVLRKVENRGAIETAHRLCQRLNSIFRFAVSAGRAAENPADMLSEALAVKPVNKRRPAVVTISEARAVLAKLDDAAVSPSVKLANRFLALTAQRPGMVQRMVWQDLHDFDPESDSSKAMWVIPSSKMKQDIQQRSDDAYAHPVPLAAAAVDVLREAWAISGPSGYVFQSARGSHKPMSENALSYLYLREGLRGCMVPHSWRSSFSTILNEWALANGEKDDRMVIDLMLAHLPNGLSASELIYNRAAYLDRRRFLASLWADMLLLNAKRPDELIVGPRRRTF